MGRRNICRILFYIRAKVCAHRGTVVFEFDNECWSFCGGTRYKWRIQSPADVSILSNVTIVRRKKNGWPSFGTLYLVVVRGRLCEIYACDETDTHLLIKHTALIHQMIWINYNCLTSTDKAPHHIIINTILYVYGQRSFADECIHTNHSQIEKQTYTTNERENRPLCVVWTHNLTKSMSTNKWPKHTRVSIHYYTRKYIYIDGVRLILIK